MMRRVVELLRFAGFWRLAASYAFNEIAWGLGIVALAAAVYARTHSPLATSGLFLASTFAPAILAPAITVAVDRLPRRHSLVAIYLAEAVVFFVLALVALGAPFPVVFALAMLDGSLALAGRALTRATIAATFTDADTLRRANALLNVMWSTGSVAGPALGGVALALAGVHATLAAAAGTFTVMALLLARAPLPTGTYTEGKWFARIRDGLAHIAGRPALRRLMTAQAGLLVACTLAVPIEVIYANENLRAGDQGYGLLLASWGVGMVAGSLIFAHAQHTRLPRLIVGALLIIAAGYSVMAVAPTLAAAAIGAALGGLGNGISVVAMLQSLQERLDEDLQARVLSLWEALGAASIGTGYLAGGVLAAVGSPRLVFAAAATAVAAVAIVLHKTLPAPAHDQAGLSGRDTTPTEPVRVEYSITATSPPPPFPNTPAEATVT